MFKKIANFIAENKLDPTKKYTAKELSEQGFMTAVLTSNESVEPVVVAAESLPVEETVVEEESLAVATSVVVAVEESLPVEETVVVEKEIVSTVVEEEIVTEKKKGGRPKKK